MWSLTITSPRSEPLQIKLAAGKMLIGRLNTCDIVIDDAAASRRHADIYYDPLPELVTIKDLNSSNGTYVNRHRISALTRLQNGDTVRIGQTVMHLAKITETSPEKKDITGTKLFTRELVLEAVDEHPIVLNDIMERLNTVLDINAVVNELTDLVRRAMGVDVCEVILTRNFENIIREREAELKIRALKNLSVEMSPHAISIPVISAGKPLALIFLEKNRAGARPFDQRDVQLGVAISHHTSLALQRIELLGEIRRGGRAKQLLSRFISPVEANGMLREYLSTGTFPLPVEKKVSVLYAEINAPGSPINRSDPKFIPAFLGPFFRYATQAVIKQNGLIKFMGDGILSIFMEGNEELSPEERAVNIGKEIIKYAKYAVPLEAGLVGVDGMAGLSGVAVHTGKVMVGYVGSQERLEFNVMGDLIKVAFHMQEQAVPNRLLVGESTVAAIQNKHLVQKTGNVIVKGEHPIQIYEVSVAKTGPFIEEDTEGGISAAFKAVAEKFRSRGQ